MAAWLCRRWTGATLTELGSAFGLRGSGSVSNLSGEPHRGTGNHHLGTAGQRIERPLCLNTQHKA